MESMKIYLASGNLNKKREMAELFPEHTIVIPRDEGIDFDPDETGGSFYENSIIKAKALYDVVGCPVLADDSGICVDALDGAPGIYSSRYAGPQFMQGKPDGSKIPQSEQNEFLISQLNEAIASGKDFKPDSKSGLFPNGPRSARYICAMVLYMGPGRIYVSQETMEGTIIENAADQRGENGFGYDPLFYLPQYGKTSAEISPEEKNAISHRGKAAKIMKTIVSQLCL